MIFCHNCEQTVPKHPSLIQCGMCGSEAVEYQDQQPQQQEQQQQNTQPINLLMQNFFSFGMNQPISNPLGLNQGVISFNNSPFELMPQPFMIPPIRTVQYVIIRREQEEQEKISVPEDKINSLSQLQNIQQECAICQESGKKGLQLPCKHEFHHECIKQWFEGKNTCPCCRKQV